jgi:uncharacterized protein (TIGR03000 family)
MYSVVLMMALSGGAESTDFGHRACAGGCTGAVSCAGDRHARHRRGHGCSGCAGAPAPVCAPACPPPPPACCGGKRAGLFHRKHGCHGCTGAPVCTGGPVGCAGGYVVPGAPSMEPKMMPKSEKIPAPPKKTKTTAAATIVVTLPSEARLTVDGNATRSTSERRTFLTPALETDADYVYTLRAELARDGTSAAQTQRVTVRGGHTTNVPFTFSTQALASR